MYIIICETDCQFRFDAWCTGMTLRDGKGSEVGEGFRMGNTLYTHGGFMSMYGKNHYNIVK